MEIGDNVKVKDDYKEFNEEGKYTIAYCSGEIGKIVGLKHETRGQMAYIELENDAYGKSNFKVPIFALNIL